MCEVGREKSRKVSAIGVKTTRSTSNVIKDKDSRLRRNTNRDTLTAHATAPNGSRNRHSAMQTTALILLRHDLRLHDNPALLAALDAGQIPVPVYIHDEAHSDWPLGAASAWWLHHSLSALRADLRRHGSDLLIFRGETVVLVTRIANVFSAAHVHWNRSYEPLRIERDIAVELGLHALGLQVHSHTGNLLREPSQLLKRDGTPYRVFTPFWKNLQKTGPLSVTGNCPSALPPLPNARLPSLAPAQLELLPRIRWDKDFPSCWQPGEAGAHIALARLCDDALLAYPRDRDRPDRPGTARLSAHLHFGELSPRQVWQQVFQQTVAAAARDMLPAAEAFMRQLAWREFAQHLLFHFPHTANQALDARFAAMPWRGDYAADLRRWQQGNTGIPIVDAGMRELKATGWMHNRVRMIVASLLTKNLLIPWQEGARWFWDTLVDADLANNSMGWQWVAGCGADAAPYFRIFNPVLQGQRFDPEGGYVRRWVPEIGRVPVPWLHQPWRAPATVLADAQLRLGVDYPEPIVDLAQSRERALDIWDSLKHQSR